MFILVVLSVYGCIWRAIFLNGDLVVLYESPYYAPMGSPSSHKLFRV